MKKRNDIILVLVILLTAGIGLLIMNLGGKEGSRAAVIIDGKETASYSLNEEKEIPIINGDNYNILIIKEGKAYMEKANCPDKICVGHRPISKVGETITCLPNKVVIKIVSDNNENLDVVV